MKEYTVKIAKEGNIAVDDTILVRGVQSAAGSHIMEGFEPLFSAEAVTRLENKGYVVSGKTQVGEFGLDLVGEFSYYAQAEEQEELKAMDKVPEDVVAGIRPVHISLTEGGIPATVDVSELMGSELHLHVNSNGKDVVIVVPTTDIDLDAVHGSHKAVSYTFRPELMHIFDKETEKNLF